MFPSLYDHQSDRLQIHLAVSRDGVHWSFPDRAKPFVALGPAGQFDSGSLYLGQGVVPVQNELWHYYSGSPLKHEEADMPLLTNALNARLFSRATLRLDGYVSVQAGEKEGSFVTPPLRYKGHTLTLNVRVKPGGFLRVGVLDDQGRPIPGFAPSDCVPVTGDHIRCPVAWTSKAGLADNATHPVALTFLMSQADLFAFQFTDSD
jgi:hypothetical protein